MPTVINVHGWRFFFYSNEGCEPMHIHCKNGDKQCKYWFDLDYYDLKEAYSYKMSAADTRFVRKILFDNFEFFKKAWNAFLKTKLGS